VSASGPNGEQRLRDRDDAVGALLREAAEAPAPDVGARTRVWALMQGRRPGPLAGLTKLGFALGLGVAMGMLVALGVQLAVRLAPAPLQADVRAAEGARWSVAGDVVRLDDGQLSVHARAPMRVVTPRAEVRVLGTVFAVEASRERTRVWVREGLVEVRSGGETARVAAGQAWPRDAAAPAWIEKSLNELAGAKAGDMDSTAIPATRAPPAEHSVSPVIAPAPVPAPTPAAPVRRTPEWEREMRAFDAAFEKERAGDAPAALAAFLDARKKWPRGAFAEERDLAIVDLTARTAAPERALAEADRFLSEHPQDARVPEVLFRRAESRRRLGDCPGALADYRAALERVPPAAPWEPQARAGLQACTP
jgi:TolA-binding protein